MGGKTSTSKSKVTIPKEVLQRYNAVNKLAENVADTPFQNYKGNFVAGINNMQQQGFQDISQSADAADPYFQQANTYTTQGAQSATPKDLDIQRYMSPYMDDVVNSTATLIDQGNAQAMSGSLGDAIKSGTFGGDRAGIAAAVLAGQQQMNRANTLAGLKQQGYQQAVSTAQQQQGVDLAAQQADLARYLQAGQQTAGLGTAAQQAGIAGGEAEINAGTLAQQTKQAELTAKYQQWLQKRGYPFQVAQFLANIAMGTGSLSGSTTTTTQPAPFFSDRRLKTDIRKIGVTDDGEMPIYAFKYKGDDQTRIGFMADEVEEKHPEAVGVAGGFKTVDYDKATRKADGGVVGPYGMQVGSEPFKRGYVPEGYLKISELRTADPSSMAKPTSAWDEISSLANFGKQLVSMKDTFGEIKDWTLGKADGGGVGDAPYLSGAPQPPETDDTLSKVLEQQDKDASTRATLKEATPPPPQPSGASQLGSAAGGIGSLLSGIAGIFALSDRDAKHDIRRIGRTNDGKLGIYAYKYDGDDRTQIGFMADEVEDVKPSAVKTIGGLKHVDYDRATHRADGGVVDIPEVPIADVPVPQPRPDIDPTAYAPLLDAISSKEAPNYYTIHGGKEFSDFSDHPRVYVPIGKGKTSSAAGRYQLIGSTWDDAKNNLGLADFSPKNQDKAASWVAINDYHKRTGRDLDADIKAGNYSDVRRGLEKTWRGLGNLDDEQFAKFFTEPRDNDTPMEKLARGGVAGFADGGVPQIVEDVPAGVAPEDVIYGDVVKPTPERLPSMKETPHRYVPPGFSLNELDGTTLIKKPEPVVRPLETRTIKDAPKVIRQTLDTTSTEQPLQSSDFSKVVNAGKGWTEVLDPEGKVIRREGVRSWRNNNPGNIEYGDFAKKLGAIGTDGRFAVFPSYDAGRKAQESLLFESPGYKDKTIAGAITRYAPPSENDTGSYVRRVAEHIGVDPNTPLSELTPEQRGKMLDAMERVEGFRPGKMLKTAGDKIVNAAQNVVEGVKDTAKETGNFVSDTGHGLKDFLDRNKGNQDLILSILSGLGTMASSPSRYLGAAVLQGIGGGAQTYAGLQKQAADIRGKDAEATRTAINAMNDSIKPIDGVNHILLEDGSYQKFWEWVKSPKGPAMGGKLANDMMRRVGQDAYRAGKDPNTMSFGDTVQVKPVEAAKVEGLPDDQQPTQVADTQPGMPVHNDTVISAPVGIPWNDASKQAVKSNEELLSQQPQMRVPLLEQTQAAAKEAQSSAQASIENLPALTEQATTVTDAIADKNMGSLGDWYAQNIVKPYNTLARSLGWSEVGGSPDADTQQIMLSKLSSLNAQNLKPEDQSSYQALKMFQEVSPNLQMTPEAASMITAQQMIRNQRNIDRALYMTETMKQAPTGEGVWTQNNDKAFNSEMTDVYLTERANIANLMQLAEQDGRVRRFMHDASSGKFKDPKDVQEILNRLLGGEVSPVLYRYFYRG